MIRDFLTKALEPRTATQRALDLLNASRRSRRRLRVTAMRDSLFQRQPIGDQDLIIVISEKPDHLIRLSHHSPPVLMIETTATTVAARTKTRHIKLSPVEAHSQKPTTHRPSLSATMAATGTRANGTGSDCSHLETRKGPNATRGKRAAFGPRWC